MRVNKNMPVRYADFNIQQIDYKFHVCNFLINTHEYKSLQSDSIVGSTFDTQTKLNL